MNFMFLIPMSLFIMVVGAIVCWKLDEKEDGT